MPVIPETAVQLIMRFEGFYSTPYKCPAGCWTIGYGHRLENEDGTFVSNDTPFIELPIQCITKEEALEVLYTKLEYMHLPQIRRTISVELNDDQLSALLSLVYNVGNIGKGLKRLINEDPFNFDAIEAKWVQYCNIKKNTQYIKLNALLQRRKIEFRTYKSLQLI